MGKQPKTFEKIDLPGGDVEIRIREVRIRLNAVECWQLENALYERTRKRCASILARMKYPEAKRLFLNIMVRPDNGPFEAFVRERLLLPPPKRKRGGQPGNHNARKAPWQRKGKPS